MDLLHFINTYWQVICGIISFVTIVVVGKNKVDQHEKRLTTLEVEHKAVNDKLFQEIRKLSDDLSFIKGIIEAKK